MKRLLILLHGLPGAGKSTLARGLSEELSEVYYAHLAASPDFRIRPASTLCAELYERYGNGYSLITEGVFSRAGYRDKLLATLVRRFQASTPFDTAIIFHIVVPPEILATRRNRSVAEYERLAKSVQTGSRQFEYREFRPTTLKKGSPTQDIERLSIIVDEIRHG